MDVPIPKHSRFTDYSGRAFGRWTVKSYAGVRGVHHYWLCSCACGTERPVNAGSLRKGVSKSCGCLAKEQMSERLLRDRTGERFGRLTVVSRTLSKARQTVWLCSCDCGNTAEVSGSALQSGNTRSCGCLRDERTRQRRPNGSAKSPSCS